MSRTLTLIIAVSVAWWPVAASAESPSDLGVEASVQQRPFVPEFQGPYNPNGGAAAQGRQLLGFTLLGTGAFAGGLGLFMLETDQSVSCARTRGCAEEDLGRVEIGAGLLIGGVFMSGMGLYLLVSDSLSARTIITTPGAVFPREQSTWRFGLTPTAGGALLSSDLLF